MLVAVGGGSAIDVAKCIKLYCGMRPGTNYLQQEIVPNSIPLLAIPTTAGSGSEATRFAVLYYHGEKQSITHPSAIPGAVFLDASALESLPEKQRKSTMLDALCHSLESCWSVHASEESQSFSCKALRLIAENADAYLQNSKNGNEKMLLAAHFAGKAINLAQTTAGHAMCYKLTTFYGLPHGQAAALCVAQLWPYMTRAELSFAAPDGHARLALAFEKIAQALGCATVSDAIAWYTALLDRLALPCPKGTEDDCLKLAGAVNPVRLQNNPVLLSESEIERLYRQILMA
jgi:alcohol dehydrogenase class IV